MTNVPTSSPTGSLTDSAYRSYLVRFWQSNDQGCWRASAQCVQSGSTVLFGTIADLLAFLQSEITISRSVGAAETRSLSAEQA